MGGNEASCRAVAASASHRDEVSHEMTRRDSPRPVWRVKPRCPFRTFKKRHVAEVRPLSCNARIRFLLFFKILNVDTEKNSDCVA